MIGAATLPKEATIGFHTHPADEAGYVVRGTLTLKTRGQPDRILHAGDSFFNPRGAIHSLQAPDSDGVAVSSWIIDKGAPLATPVPYATSAQLVAQTPDERRDVPMIMRERSEIARVCSRTTVT